MNGPLGRAGCQWSAQLTSLVRRTSGRFCEAPPADLDARATTSGRPAPPIGLVTSGGAAHAHHCLNTLISRQATHEGLAVVLIWR